MTTLLESPVIASTSTAYSVTFAEVGQTFVTKGSSAQPHTVLRDVSLEIDPAEVVVILGASGCGKSTLLRLASGLDSPTAGTVLIDDSPVRNVDRRTAVGFQEPRLLPWRSVADNVALGLPKSISKSQGRERVETLLELVGLHGFASHRPREISGGMAQRASLARALARNPGVLLLDEPFGALDALTRINMQDLLLDIHETAPTTVLLVTHDVDEALQLADRIIVLGHAAGRSGASIIQDIVVPGTKPRDRSSIELAELRSRLLASLGVHRHGIGQDLTARSAS